jgi:hypothetical protein
MSSSECQAGDIEGFPLTISQTLRSAWPGVALNDVYNKIQKITVPNQYSVNWSNPTYGNMINVVKPATPNGVLQITGFDSYAQQTTLTYGGASYRCSYIMSIVQNQHRLLLDNTNSNCEIILSFQITNKNENPSSPHVILLCRPLIISPGKNNLPLWSAIDTACSTSTPQSTTVNLSSIYTFNNSVLMPFISYQSCIPVKVIESDKENIQSLRIRVNVVMQPLYLTLESVELNTSVTKYTLPTNPAGIFSQGSLSEPTIQFKDGGGPYGFPIHKNTNLKLSLPTIPINDIDTVLKKIEVQVPEDFLGKSLNDISSATSIPPVISKKKSYKCYTIDPKKDIVNGEIMVDPTTGQNLDSAKAQIYGNNNVPQGTNLELGIMPGDAEYALSVTVTVIGVIMLIAYLIFIVLKGREIYTIGGNYGDFLLHVISFIIIFIILIIFGAFVENPAKAKRNS